MRVGKHELAGRGLNLVAKVVALGWWHVQWVAQGLRDWVYLVRSLDADRIGADGPRRTAVAAVATAHPQHLGGEGFVLPDRLEATIDSPHGQPVVAEWRRREETRLRAIRRVVVVLARVFHGGGFPRPLCTSASPPSSRLTAALISKPFDMVLVQFFFSRSEDDHLLVFQPCDKGRGLPGGRERGQ
jgi:hypothetical protein